MKILSGIGGWRYIFKDEKVIPFFGTMILFGIVVGLWGGVMNNWLHGILDIGRKERGFIEFPRELPGLLLFLMVGLLSKLSEFRLMRTALLASAAGMTGLAVLGDNRIAAVGFIVVMSSGEHLMMPVRQSLGIHMSQPGKEGLAMGAIRSAGNIGQVVGYYLIPVIFLIIRHFRRNNPGYSDFLPYRTVFIFAALLLVAGLILTKPLGKKGEHIQPRKIQLKKHFRKYYILEVFFGARKQVFLTFAPYVLIMVYDAPTELIATLYGIWSLANIFVGPLIGKLLDHFGYKKIIIADAVFLTFLCLIYGWANTLLPYRTAYIVTIVVFVLDAMSMAVSMARALYAKKVSKPDDDVTGTLSTGISINHFVSIIIAVLGGMLWESLGMPLLFSIAALFGLMSMLFATTLENPNTLK